jgi:hypothetical protein
MLMYLTFFISLLPSLLPSLPLPSSLSPQGAQGTSSAIPSSLNMSNNPLMGSERGQTGGLAMNQPKGNGVTGGEWWGVGV